MKTKEIQEKYAKDYSGGKLSRPAIMEYADQEQLDKLCLAWCQYVYGSYCSNETIVQFGGYSRYSGRTMRELRMYGRGANTAEKYQKILDPTDHSGEGYYNISWDTVKIYSSKFRNIVRGMMDAIKFDFQTNAIDETARKERELKKNRAKISLNPAMQKLGGALGLKQAYPPGTSEQDVDILFKLGGERLAYEILMNAAILSTMYESRWEDVIRDMLIDDGIDIGILATETYLEKATRKVKANYVDPENLVARASAYPDGRDRDFAGYFSEVSISELRMRCDLPEKDIYLIAKKYMGAMGNAQAIGAYRESFPNRSFREEYMASKGYQVYDNFRVQLLKLYFICGETEKYIMGVHPDGNRIYDQVEPGASLDKSDVKRGKSFEEKHIQNVYSCYWVVGTDCVFDCQKEYGIVRYGEPGNKQATLPLKVWVYDGPSITESCIGYIDDINLATFKKRHALAKLPPGPRMVVDKSKLRDSVMIGKDSYSLTDLTALFEKTGIMVVESKGEFDVPGMQSSQTSPFQFLPAGVVEDINIFFQEIAGAIEGIRSVTGINEVADGTARGDILVGVASGLQTATNNSLRPHFRMYESLFRENCQYWMKKWQVALVGGQIDIRYTPIGEDMVKAANLTEMLMDYEFGVTLEVLPNDEEKILLLRHLFELWTKGGMRADDYFVAESMVKGNKMKQAKLFISRAVDAREKEMHAKQMQMVQANGEANAITATATERAHALTVEVETKAKIMLAMEEHKLTIQRLREEHRLKMLEKGYEVTMDAMVSTQQ